MQKKQGHECARPHSFSFVRIHQHSSAFIRLGRCCGRTSSRLTVLRMGGYYPLFCGHYPAVVVLLSTVLRPLSCSCGVTILFCGHYPAVVALLYCTAAVVFCHLLPFPFTCHYYSIFFVSFGMNGNNLNNVRDEIRLLWVFFSLT